MSARKVDVVGLTIELRNDRLYFLDSEEEASLSAETQLIADSNDESIREHFVLPRRCLFTKVDRHGEEISGLLFDSSTKTAALHELPNLRLRVIRLPLYAVRKTVELSPLVQRQVFGGPVVLAEMKRQAPPPVPSRAELDALEKRLLNRPGRS